VDGGSAVGDSSGGDSSGALGDSAGGAVPTGLGDGVSGGATEEGTVAHGPIEPARENLHGFDRLVLARRFCLRCDRPRALVCGQWRSLVR